MSDTAPAATGDAAPTTGTSDAAPAAGTSAARRGRETVVAVVGCLLGAALVLFAGGATWVSGVVVDAAAGDAVAPLAFELTGSDLAPAASALGLAGLAAVVAVVATRRLGRALTGFGLVVVGLGVVYLAGRVLADPSSAVRASAEITEVAPAGAVEFRDLRRSAAGWVAALGGLVLAASGLGVALRGARWPTMSGRYERRPALPVDAWEAIERGEDPT
jgi:uncharacterized membrane protein (TIGR02234 family)